MSNRRRVTQVQDKQRIVPRGEHDFPEAHASHEHHQASSTEVARRQGMARRARLSENAMLAAQANTMRLKKGNAARHG
jgi:hypothetical protein